MSNDLSTKMTDPHDYESPERQVVHFIDDKGTAFCGLETTHTHRRIIPNEAILRDKKIMSEVCKECKTKGTKQC